MRFAVSFFAVVNKNLYSLIRDMEIFRDQLVKAEICHCKLEKYEMAIKATENCLHGIKEVNLRRKKSGLKW